MMNVDFSFRRRVKKYFFFAMWMVALSTILMSYVIFFTHHGNNIRDDLRALLNDQASDFGFTLRKVTIHGQNNTQAEYILSSLNLDQGTPIFSINLNQLRLLLEENDWVQHAVVARKLPDALYIGLIERKAIAIWQNNNNVSLIDSEGHSIKVKDIKPFNHLLYVVGSDANLHAEDLITLLSTNDALKSRVISAVRYGQRRWNLLLEDNVTVSLPENNAGKAWQYLIDLNSQKKLFGAGLKNIDLRDENRYYLTK
jgi:cell division protein FtsQ